MKYDVSKKEVKQILTTANILNTLHGGMIEPQIQVKRDTKNYHVKVTVPGVSEDKLKVEIVDKNLIVSHEMEFETTEGALVVPHVIAVCPLSLNIDHEKISADYEHGVLHVMLPLSDFTSGYRREIDINLN